MEVDKETKTLTPNQNQTHLEQKLNLGLDDALTAVVEQFSAVACRAVSPSPHEKK